MVQFVVMPRRRGEKVMTLVAILSPREAEVALAMRRSGDGSGEECIGGQTLSSQGDALHISPYERSHSRDKALRCHASKRSKENPREVLILEHRPRLSSKEAFSRFTGAHSRGNGIFLRLRRTRTSKCCPLFPDVSSENIATARRFDHFHQNEQVNNSSEYC